MAIHINIEKAGIYFITFTCHDWHSLIAVSDGYSAVYNFFEVLAKQNHTVLSYVIMPNHIHMLLYYSGGKSLNTVVGNGKRFMAHEIVKLLGQKNEESLLEKLKKGVEEKDRSRGKKHEVWKKALM